MNRLAHSLGLSSKLAFHEVYSLIDPDLLSFIPRPVYALLAIIPLTDRWNELRHSEDDSLQNYDGAGPQEPTVWFKQTIPRACGSIGFLHCAFNGEAADFIEPGSELSTLLQQAIPLGMKERAKVLEDSNAIFHAHEAAAQMGESRPLQLRPGEHVGQHFVAFVKGKDGHLWELEGTRKRPLDRGALADDEDALSEKAIACGLGTLIEMERNSGANLRFSCIALAPATTVT